MDGGAEGHESLHTATSCTITGLTAITAGNIGILASTYSGSGITFSSGSGGGSYTNCTPCIAAGNLMAYNLSMTGGGTTAGITVTWRTIPTSEAPRLTALQAAST